MNDLPQVDVGLGLVLTENEEESEDGREGSEAEIFQSPCVLNSNPFIPRRNSRNRNEANNQDSGLENKESQMGNMPTNDTEKENVQAPFTPRPIEVLCQNQEDQAAMIIPLQGSRFSTEKLNNKQRNIVNLKSNLRPLKQ